MDVLTIILLLLILTLIIAGKNSISDKFRELEYRITELQNLLRLHDAQKKAAESVKTEAGTVAVPPVPVVKPAAVPPPPVVKVPEPVKSPEVNIPEEPKPEPIIERYMEVISDSSAPINRPVKTWEPPIKPYKPQLTEEPGPSFFERYPDLEKFIGENLVNKIGIAILVLAIGFFVKYAIDNNWIGPVGRVGIGILCGGILVAFAHRMRNSYKAFSSVLTGGGLAIFYFTITLAFQQFHLFSQTSP